MSITKEFLQEQQQALTRKRDQMVANLQHITGALEVLAALQQRLETPEAPLAKTD